MNCKKLIARTFLFGPVLAVILSAGILIGCSGDNGPGEGRDSGGETTSQGGESGGEHPGGEGEGAEGSGGEGSESGGESGSESGSSGGEEGSGATLGLNETFDMVRGGARLILSYDAASNSFKGTVENTTNNVLTRVRIEVHLSNGTELGPTAPVDMAPGQVLTIDLPATAASFTGWVAHAEVGGGGEGRESGGEGGGTGAEAGEAAMSSPITPLESVVERCSRRTGCFGAVRCSNPVCPRNGTKHALTGTMLRANRTSPEVGDADGRGAWSRSSWET